METHLPRAAGPRRARAGRARATVLLVAVAAAGALACLASRGPRAPRFVAPSLGPATVDLAVACLGAGETRPELAAVGDEDFQAAVSILARLIAAYAEGDYGSYLALRAGDLAHAETVQAEHCEEVRGYCRSLGVAPEALPRGWIGLLGAYWEAYYRRPPLERVVPEGARVEWHAEGLGARTIEAWEQDFEARCTGRGEARLDHHPMVPHRRTIDAVVRDAGRLRWLDVELAYVAPDAVRGRLIARFVWDTREEEWFLHRATSVLDGELGDDRRYLVL